MDRTAWIVVILCVIGLVAWEVWVTRQRLPQPTVVPVSSPSASPSASASPALDNIATATPPPRAVAAASASPAAFPERTEVMRNGDMELKLTNRGGGIAETTLLNHALANGENVRITSPHLPIGAIVTTPESPELPEFTFAQVSASAVEMTSAAGTQVTTRKRFTFPASKLTKDNFVLSMDVDFVNGGPTPLHFPAAYVGLGSAAPTHGNDYPTYTRLAWCVNGSAKGIDVNWFAAQNYPLIGVQKRPAQPFYTEKLNGAEWAGTTNQFFATIVTPLTAKGGDVWGRRFPFGGTDTAPVYAIEGALGLPGFDLRAGETKTLKFEIYSGPKIYARLAAMEQDQAEIMNFGLWKLVSQFLLNFMNLLHRILGNYAAAIVVLTIAIKGVLWPLQNKANSSMRRMSALSPKMQELKEKYKDDPQRMQQEVMKLYKEYGVNPVGGCLPMLIQIPIFFGLLSMLGQAVELRNAKFLWVRDLSQPDTVAHLPGLGWPINILPLCMALTNVWLMRMTPKTGDSAQQRVLMFMPLIFLFFCYNFAAALALYYTTLNLLTVLQLYVNQRRPMPVLTKVSAPEQRTRKRR